jgi:hypothetical protein
MIYLFLIARMCILHQEEKKIMNVMERQRRRTIVLKSAGKVQKKKSSGFSDGADSRRNRVV